MKNLIIITLFSLPFNLYAFFQKEDPIWFPASISLDNDGHILTEMDGGFAVPFLEARGTPITGVRISESITMGPLVGGDLSVGSRIIIGLEDTAVLDEDGTLLQDKGSKGYYVIEKNSFDVTLGPNLAKGMGALSGSIAVAGSFGREVLTKRIINSKSELKKTFIPKVPKNLQMIKPMRVGDSYSYTTQGGILVSGSGGPVASGITGALRVEGLWKLEIQKASEKSVYVILSRYRITNVRGSGGIPLSSVSIAKIKKTIKRFIYEFDLSSPDGLELYLSFLKGDIKEVDEKLSKNPSLTKVATPQIAVKGIFDNRQLRTSVSVPVVFSLGLSSDKIKSFIASNYLGENLVVNTYLGIYKRQSWINTPFMKFLAKIKNATVANFDTNKLFMGHVKEFVGLENQTGGKINTFGANLRIKIEGDNFTKKGFKFAATKMATWTGFEDVFLEIKSPKDILGHAEFILDVAFSNKAIERLIIEAEKMSKEQFSQMALVAVNNYVRNTNDPFNYCAGDIEVGNFPKSCERRIQKLTGLNMKIAHSALLKMRALLNKKNYKRLSKEFANLGLGLSMNHFTLKTMWWMMKDAPIEAKITIQGEDIQRYQKPIKIFRGKKYSMESFLKDTVQKMWD